MYSDWWLLFYMNIDILMMFTWLMYDIQVRGWTKYVLLFIVRFLNSGWRLWCTKLVKDFDKDLAWHGLRQALVKEELIVMNKYLLSYVILDITKFCCFILIGHRNGDFVSTLEFFLYVSGEVVTRLLSSVGFDRFNPTS